MSEPEQPAGKNRLTKAERSRIGRCSKRKGKVWEQEVARDLRELYPGVHRGHQDARGGAGAGEGCDIEGTPYYVETRHEKSYDWRRHLREATTRIAERGDRRPLFLVAKEDRKPAGWVVGDPGTRIVVMLYDEWLRMIRTIAANAPLKNEEPCTRTRKEPNGNS